MALFLITVKKGGNSNGVQLDTGMSVEVSSKYSNPLMTNGGLEVIDAFQRKYGIDLKKYGGGSISSVAVYLDVKKIS